GTREIGTRGARTLCSVCIMALPPSCLPGAHAVGQSQPRLTGRQIAFEPTRKQSYCTCLGSLLINILLGRTKQIHDIGLAITRSLSLSLLATSEVVVGGWLGAPVGKSSEPGGGREGLLCCVHADGGFS
uniref:Uncharacterized protein n=1 Tax=Aegilops tauschii subsp. strangulata TaxID=200361 RepID=A0A453BC30_AEGTS